MHVDCASLTYRLQLLTRPVNRAAISVTEITAARLTAIKLRMRQTLRRQRSSSSSSWSVGRQTTIAAGRPRSQLRRRRPPTSTTFSPARRRRHRTEFDEQVAQRVTHHLRIDTITFYCLHRAYCTVHCVPKKTRDHIFDDKLK